MDKKKTNVAAIIFLNKNGEILLQKKTLDFKRWPGRWSMFGGKIEKGETPETALRREVKEELGLKLPKIKFFKIHDYQEKSRAGKMYVFTAAFTANLSDISLKEGAGFAFFAPTEIKQLRLIDHDNKIVKEFIKSFLSGKK